MIRLLNKIGLPNVVSFNLTDNEPIIEAYMAGLPANTNRQLRDIKKTRRVNKSNKYLGTQFRRLERMSSTNPKGFDYLALKLLQKSITYRIYAINVVCPQWISMNFSKVSKMERSVRKLAKGLATDINYKRVWIDKKPGDYGRPLGVPEIEWRIYLRMITNIGEIYAKGMGYYAECQHGGRPGYGVMTCLKSMAEKLRNFDNIYEFDLKGFFDHISIESITSKFGKVFLGELFNKMLRAKPKGYTLPPEEEDSASKAVKEDSQEIEENWTPLYTKDLPKFDEVLNLDGTIGKYYGEPVVLLEKGDEMYEEVFGEGKQLGFQPDWMEYAAKLRSEHITFRQSLGRPSQKGREKGRDAWKDLDLPDQGVPQGTSFGPFLASLVLGLGMRRIPNSLVYLDDGLCFFNTEEELAKIKAELSKILEEIKVEIAPEKSRVVSKSNLLTQGIKFLGTRFKGKRDFFSIASETRRGVSRELPELSSEKMLEILENMYLEGMITPSKYKLSKWGIIKGELNKSFYPISILDNSIKYNFFGFLLSWLYNPEVDMNDMKRKIREGTYIAERKLKSSKGSIGEGIITKNLICYQTVEGDYEYVKPSIYNASTLAIDLYLETYEYGNVSLREFGLDVDKEEIYYSTAGASRVKVKRSRRFSVKHGHWRVRALKDNYGRWVRNRLLD